MSRSVAVTSNPAEHTDFAKIVHWDIKHSEFCKYTSGACSFLGL